MIVRAHHHEEGTGILQLQQGTSPLFEYACHEVNYGMMNALSGARMAENADK